MGLKIVKEMINQKLEILRAKEGAGSIAHFRNNATKAKHRYLSAKGEFEQMERECQERVDAHDRLQAEYQEILRLEIQAALVPDIKSEKGKRL
jgi:hypothetical protein